MNRSESPSIGDTIEHPNMFVGQTWADPLGRMQITLDSADASGAHVTIRPVPPVSQPKATVPNILFITRAAAQNAITGARLVTGTVTTEEDSVCSDAGNVIRQSPTAGVVLPVGKRVDFVVATPGSGCSVG
jgi:hypothetical protein